MACFALIQNSIVGEFVQADSMDELRVRYHPEIAAQFVPMTDSESRVVQPGWLYDGSGFSSPMPPPEPEPAVMRLRTENLPAAGGATTSILEILARLQDVGRMDDFGQKLLERPSVLMRLMFVSQVVPNDDPRITEILRDLNIDPAKILNQGP